MESPPEPPLNCINSVSIRRSSITEEEDKCLDNKNEGFPIVPPKLEKLEPINNLDEIPLSQSNLIRRSQRQVKQRFSLSTLTDNASTSSDEEEGINQSRKPRLKSSTYMKVEMEDVSMFPSSSLTENKSEKGLMLMFDKIPIDEIFLDGDGEWRRDYRQHVTRKDKDGNYTQVEVVASRALNTYGKNKKAVYNWCVICKEDCTSKEKYSKHMKDIHSRNGPDGQKEYVCPTCSKGYADITLFNKHLKRSHIPYESVQPLENTPLKRERRKEIFKCEICEKELKSLDTYDKHQKFHERNSQDPTKPFECPVCHIRFKKERLKLHMTLHRKDNPYVCQFYGCGKKFDGSHSLQKHVKLHTTDRQDLRCPHCSGTFSIEKYLNRHVLKYHSSARHYNESGHEEKFEPNKIRIPKKNVYYVKPIDQLSPHHEYPQKSRAKLKSAEVDSVSLSEESQECSLHRVEVGSVDLDSIHEKASHQQTGSSESDKEMLKIGNVPSITSESKHQNSDSEMSTNNFSRRSNRRITIRKLYNPTPDPIVPRRRSLKLVTSQIHQQKKNVKSLPKSTKRIIRTSDLKPSSTHKKTALQTSSFRSNEFTNTTLPPVTSIIMGGPIQLSENGPKPKSIKIELDEFKTELEFEDADSFDLDPSLGC